MKVKQKSRGITLIALVITIIVLLILAGVSIATLGGDNGIIGRAKKAKTTTEEKQAEEEAVLLVNEYEMYKKMCETEGKEPNVAEFLEKNYKDKYKLEDGKYKIETESGENLEIDDKGNVKLDGEVVKANNTKSIVITGETEVQLDQTILLTATIGEEGEMYKDIEWSSTDTTKVTVEGNGETCAVTGMQKGSVSIVCKVTNYDGTIISKEHQINVIGKNVIDITISGNNAVEIGKSITLTVAINPSDAEYKSIEWKSNDLSKATISYNGTSCVVTGVGEGNTSITCNITNNNDISINKEYAISVKSKSVTSVTISGGTSVEINSTITLTANITPSDAKYKSISWSSNNSSIATATGNGTSCVVKGINAGSTKITCSLKNNDDTTIVKDYDVTVLGVSKLNMNCTSASYWDLSTDGVTYSVSWLDGDGLFLGGTMCGNSGFRGFATYKSPVVSVTKSSKVQFNVSKQDSTGTFFYQFEVGNAIATCNVTGTGTYTSSNFSGNASGKFTIKCRPVGTGIKWFSSVNLLDK